MTQAPSDVIDHLVGIAPGSKLDGIRSLRPQARENAQASYAALFRPTEPGDVTLAERHAIATFVAGLHGDEPIAAFYAAGLEPALAAAAKAEAKRGATKGPYGNYPSAALAAENTAGLSCRVDAANRAALGPKLTAAFEHAHMLVFHPRDASGAALQALLDSGISTNGIVTISQAVAFLAFQIRAVEGLRVLAAA